MKKLLVCVVAIGFLFVIGCGGDDGDSGPSGSTKASELTEQEATDLCEKWSGKMEAAYDPQHFSCVMAGLMAGMGDATMCQTAYDACMAEEYTPEPNDCDNAYADTTECPDVTVGEMEACLQAQIDALSDFDDLSCDTPLTDLENPDEQEMPAECTAIIEEKCPNM